MLSLSDNRNKKSISSSYRLKRTIMFLELLPEKNGVYNILDVGGSSDFWKDIITEKKLQITILNLDDNVHENIKVKNITFIHKVGDCRKMDFFKDKSFDAVFSNSVIEHVGTFEDQKMMASEVIRVANFYFIQTPNLYFPIEPHFLVPFFQFFPLFLKVLLVKNFTLGWVGKEKNREDALNTIKSIRLLNYKEMNLLFPKSYIFREKFLGLTKSFFAYKHIN